MVKANKPGAQNQKPSMANLKAAETKKTPASSGQAKAEQKSVGTTPLPKTPETGKSKQSGKSNRPKIGGTAVAGAKSTTPKEINTASSNQQQAESYNRDMRRRMQHLGTGPYGESQTPLQQQRKRYEKRKKRIEERRQEGQKAAAAGPRNISLGRRNTYFLIGVVALLVIIIALAIILRH